MTPERTGVCRSMQTPRLRSRPDFCARTRRAATERSSVVETGSDPCGSHGRATVPSHDTKDGGAEQSGRGATPSQLGHPLHLPAHRLHTATRAYHQAAACLGWEPQRRWVRPAGNNSAEAQVTWCQAAREAPSAGVSGARPTMRRRAHGPFTRHRSSKQVWPRFPLLMAGAADSKPTPSPSEASVQPPVPLEDTTRQ